MENRPFRLYENIKFDCASLIVGWHEDVGGVGDGVIRYLIDNLECRLLAEVEPSGFFPLNGIQIVDDVAEFPESKLYYCPGKNLLIFSSQLPNAAWYRFLNTVIDMSNFHCRMDRIFSVGGLVSLDSAPGARKVVSVSNTLAMKKSLVPSGIDTKTNYETPDGQRPTLSTFMMWMARLRNIPMATIWAQIPYYLASIDDPHAWRLILDFLDKELNLKLSMERIDKETEDYDSRIADARSTIPEFNSLLGRIEASELLSPEDSEKLVDFIEEALGY